MVAKESNVNYKYLLDVLNSGLPLGVSHYDIIANQMMVMHMTKHGQFSPELYKEEVQGFIDYAKEHLSSRFDEHGIFKRTMEEPFYEDVELVLGLQIQAVDAVKE